MVGAPINSRAETYGAGETAIGCLAIAIVLSASATLRINSCKSMFSAS